MNGRKKVHLNEDDHKEYKNYNKEYKNDNKEYKNYNKDDRYNRSY